MKKIVVAILLILPLSLIKSQVVLNIKGKKYISLSGQYLPDQQVFETGYNKYLTSKSVFGIHARYLKEDINYTRIQTGFGVIKYSRKLLSPGERWLLFGYGSASLGMEQHSSTVEEGKKSRFIYGATVGLFSEILVADNLTFTISGDINTRWRSMVNSGYYTIRLGLNYYIK